VKKSLAAFCVTVLLCALAVPVLAATPGDEDGGEDILVGDEAFTVRGGGGIKQLFSKIYWLCSERQNIAR
jgi:hypothetical protein